MSSKRKLDEEKVSGAPGASENKCGKGDTVRLHEPLTLEGGTTNDNDLGSHEDSGLLPIGYIPTSTDVVCGCPKNEVNDSGNQRYRKIVQKNIGPYLASRSKDDKSHVVLSIIMQVQNGNPRGDFIRKAEPRFNKMSGGQVNDIKKNSDRGSGTRWRRLTHTEARDKCSHALRKVAQQFEAEHPDIAAQMRKGHRSTPSVASVLSNPRALARTKSSGDGDLTQADEIATRKLSSAKRQRVAHGSDPILPPQQGSLSLLERGSTTGSTTNLTANVDTNDANPTADAERRCGHLATTRTCMGTARSTIDGTGQSIPANSASSAFLASIADLDSRQQTIQDRTGDLVSDLQERIRQHQLAVLQQTNELRLVETSLQGRLDGLRQEGFDQVIGPHLFPHVVSRSVNTIPDTTVDLVASDVVPSNSIQELCLFQQMRPHQANNTAAGRALLGQLEFRERLQRAHQLVAGQSHMYPQIQSQHIHHQNSGTLEFIMSQSMLLRRLQNQGALRRDDALVSPSWLGQGQVPPTLDSTSFLPSAPGPVSAHGLSNHLLGRHLSLVSNPVTGSARPPSGQLSTLSEAAGSSGLDGCHYGQNDESIKKEGREEAESELEEEETEEGS